MDRKIEFPSDTWQSQWINRTYNPLRGYLLIASYTLSLSIICLGITGFFTIRRSTKQLLGEPSNRASIFASMHKKVLRVTRGHFYVAIAYLLHVIIMALVDGIISFVVLKHDATAHPDAWNTALLLELAIGCLLLLGLFIAAFTLFPLLQMLAVTHFLLRFSKHRNLDAFIPEARFFTTHVAQLWCMLSFFVEAWWAPSASNSIRRYVVIQACFGSGLAWLEASYAFNFHSDKIEQEDLESTNEGVRAVLAMFGKTLRAVHAEKSDLPTYDDTPKMQQSLLVAEKA